MTNSDNSKEHSVQKRDSLSTSKTAKFKKEQPQSQTFAAGTIKVNNHYLDNPDNNSSMSCNNENSLGKIPLVIKDYEDYQIKFNIY